MYKWLTYCGQDSTYNKFYCFEVNMELWCELVLASKLLNNLKQIILILFSCLNSKTLLLMQNVDI